MLENHVSVVRDLNGFLDWIPVIPTSHEYVSGTTGIPSPAMLNLEFLAPMLWPPGYATGKNKFTSSVLHKGWWICLEEHDLGMGLAHVPAVMDDVLAPLHILTSSRKSNFSSGAVKANGKPFAACTMFDTGLLPTPMKQCDQLPLPTTGPGMSFALNDCLAGMHWADYVAGVLSMLADYVLARLTAGVGGTGPITMPNGLQVVPFLVRLAAQEFGGYGGDAKLKLGVGFTEILGVEVELVRAGDTHRWSVEGGGRVGHESLGPRLLGKGKWSEGEPGRPSVLEGDVGGGFFGGEAVYHESTDERDGAAGRVNPTMPWGQGSEANPFEHDELIPEL